MLGESGHMRAAGGNSAPLEQLAAELVTNSADKLRSGRQSPLLRAGCQSPLLSPGKSGHHALHQLGDPWPPVRPCPVHSFPSVCPSTCHVTVIFGQGLTTPRVYLNARPFTRALQPVKTPYLPISAETIFLSLTLLFIYLLRIHLHIYLFVFINFESVYPCLKTAIINVLKLYHV